MTKVHSKKSAFIVEHDFIMATYLADRVIVFDGSPGLDARANKPETLLSGCNKFLKNLDVTFRVRISFLLTADFGSFAGLNPSNLLLGTISFMEHTWLFPALLRILWSGVRANIMG